jgi:hypothetical protein
MDYSYSGYINQFNKFKPSYSAITEPVWNQMQDSDKALMISGLSPSAGLSSALSGYGSGDNPLASTGDLSSVLSAEDDGSGGMGEGFMGWAGSQSLGDWAKMGGLALQLVSLGDQKKLYKAQTGLLNEQLATAKQARANSNTTRKAVTSGSNYTA